MPQFFGEIKGSRGRATKRKGTKASGIVGAMGGQHVGVRVECHYDKYAEKEVCVVYKTGGSSQPMTAEKIAEFSENGEGQPWHTSTEKFADQAAEHIGQETRPAASKDMSGDGTLESS